MKANPVNATNAEWVNQMGMCAPLLSSLSEKFAEVFARGIDRRGHHSDDNMIAKIAAAARRALVQERSWFLYGGIVPSQIDAVVSSPIDYNPSTDAIEAATGSALRYVAQLRPPLVATADIKPSSSSTMATADDVEEDELDNDTIKTRTINDDDDDNDNDNNNDNDCDTTTTTGDAKRSHTEPRTITHITKQSVSFA